MERWQKLAEKFNNISLEITTNEGKTYDIRPLLATDAVHNNQHVSGTILFPHNIGLSCSHNPNNFLNVGKIANHLSLSSVEHINIGADSISSLGLVSIFVFSICALLINDRSSIAIVSNFFI